MERKIGEIFECDGKKLQVIEDPFNICDGCYFVNETDCEDRLDIRGFCSYIRREDKHCVTFKEVKDMNEENNKSILSEAEEIVNGSRHSDYGDARESFSRVATIASVMTGKELAPEDCCAVLMAVKLVRESFAHKRDNLIDLCGYAYIMNEIKESNKKGEQDEKD